MAGETKTVIGGAQVGTAKVTSPAPEQGPIPVVTTEIGTMGKGLIKPGTEMRVTEEQFSDKWMRRTTKASKD